MNNKSHLELIIKSNDQEKIEEIIKSIEGIEVYHPRAARTADPITVLAIAAGTITLVNALIQLATTLSKREPKIEITVRNVDGNSIELKGASREKIAQIVESD